MRQAPGSHGLKRSYINHCIDSKYLAEFFSSVLIFKGDLCMMWTYVGLSFSRSKPVSLLMNPGSVILFPPTLECTHKHRPTRMLMATFMILGTNGKISQGWNEEGILTNSLDGQAASGVLCLGHPDSHFLLTVSEGHSPLEAAHIPWIAFLLHLPSLQWWAKFLSCF